MPRLLRVKIKCAREGVGRNIVRKLSWTSTVMETKDSIRFLTASSLSRCRMISLEITCSVSSSVTDDVETGGMKCVFSRVL